MTDLRLSDAEREVASEEVATVLAAAPEREELRELAGAIDGSLVPEALAPLLERIVELGLQSGRIRAVYGPGGEQAALKLFRRLPAGREAAETAREVSSALAAFEGRTLEAVSVSTNGPGAFTLSLRADGMDVSVRLDRSGARLGTVAA
jgi:hypothetical protein